MNVQCFSGAEERAPHTAACSNSASRSVVALSKRSHLALAVSVGGLCGAISRTVQGRGDGKCSLPRAQVPWRRFPVRYHMGNKSPIIRFLLKVVYYGVCRGCEPVG
jgi:hypothetical protein